METGPTEYVLTIKYPFTLTLPSILFSPHFLSPSLRFYQPPIHLVINLTTCTLVGRGRKPQCPWEESL